MISFRRPAIQESRHGKNFNVAIFSVAGNVINIKLCMLVLLIELYQFISLSVTLSICEGHSNVPTVLTENFTFSSSLVETLCDCWLHQLDHKYTTIFFFPHLCKGLSVCCSCLFRLPWKVVCN